jgi:predicted nucleotidyltransferase
MYTVRKDRPLAPVMLQVLADITEKQGIPHVIIGATARDILMTHVFGIDAGRATRDVDLAIAVKDWKQFDAIKAAFVERGDFTQAVDQTYRLHYREKDFGSTYPLDLIPFGPIADDDNVIAWPPDMQVIMSVAGYAEALDTAVQVELGNGVVSNFVSIPALASLKLLAWQSRGLENGKDAQDFYFILKNYHRAGNEARLYDEAFSILESSAFDLELAGAALLGRDMTLMLEPRTHQAISDLLDGNLRERLLIHMDRSLLADMTVTLRFLEHFGRGLKLPIS